MLSRARRPDRVIRGSRIDRRRGRVTLSDRSRGFRPSPMVDRMPRQAAGVPIKRCGDRREQCDDARDVVSDTPRASVLNALMSNRAARRPAARVGRCRPLAVAQTIVPRHVDRAQRSGDAQGGMALPRVELYRTA
jgi:hypothetical protein